jgi:hypothetical protein
MTKKIIEFFQLKKLMKNTNSYNSYWLQFHKQKHHQHSTQHASKAPKQMIILQDTKLQMQCIKTISLVATQHKTTPTNKTKTNSCHTTLKIKLTAHHLLQEILCKQLNF